MINEHVDTGHIITDEMLNQDLLAHVLACEYEIDASSLTGSERPNGHIHRMIERFDIGEDGDDPYVQAQMVEVARRSYEDLLIIADDQ